MRFQVPLCVFLSVAAFHSVLSASLESGIWNLESGGKEEKAAQYDGLTELQKIDDLGWLIDQMEFEAAQKDQAAQMNVTEDQNEDTRYLEAAQDGSVEEHDEAENDNTAEGGGDPETAAPEESESESSEETDGRQRREHHEVVTEAVSSLDEVSQDSPEQQDVLE